jgi:hypothetical protein
MRGRNYEHPQPRTEHVHLIPLPMQTNHIEQPPRTEHIQLIPLPMQTNHIKQLVSDVRLRIVARMVEWEQTLRGADVILRRPTLARCAWPCGTKMRRQPKPREQGLDNARHCYCNTVRCSVRGPRKVVWTVECVAKKRW